MYFTVMAALWEFMQKHVSLLGPRLRSGTSSLPLLFTGPDKAQCQFRVKGWGKEHHLFSKRICKVPWQRAWLQTGMKNWGHNCNLPPNHTQRAVSKLPSLGFSPSFSLEFIFSGLIFAQNWTLKIQTIATTEYRGLPHALLHSLPRQLLMKWHD